MGMLVIVQNIVKLEMYGTKYYKLNAPNNY